MKKRTKLCIAERLHAQLFRDMSQLGLHLVGYRGLCVIEIEVEVAVEGLVMS